MLHNNPWRQLIDTEANRDAKYLEAVLGLPEPDGSDEYLKSWKTLNRAHVAFFDQESWSVDAAIYFFGAGELIRGSREPAARLMRAVMKAAPLRHQDEERLPLPIKLWIESLRADDGDWPFIARCRPNDWMRWAVQKKLPIHSRCWLAHQSWKMSCWGKGVQMAVSTLSFANEQYELQVPAEHTWYVPFQMERTAESRKGTEIWWDYFWHLPTAELVEAVMRAKTRSNPTDTAEERLQRIRAVGAGSYRKIEAAVRDLAKKFKTKIERVAGRYVIDLKRADLIDALRKIDPALTSVGISSFHHALPALVQGRRPGRPRKP